MTLTLTNSVTRYMMKYCRESAKLTEVTVSDKLESFRASKEVLASDENFFVTIIYYYLVSNCEHWRCHWHLFEPCAACLLKPFDDI